ncbi:class I SAM-dependent methyltransferase [Yunchengibacter salinarum]|uniref:class I SAM-dependent methyltransferase n=1 Tax=Yunchengibacter salinarum TaxID=3133399 RepID=UPI0035B64543
MSGVRENIDDFYKNMYQLMMFSKDSEIKSFTNDGAKSQSQRSCDFFLEMVNPNQGARILEAGAGKGFFMGHLQDKRPDLELHAFEPGKAYEILKEKLPDVEIERCDYTEYQKDEGTYDVVLSLGVLEHVQNPLDMLKWKRALLKEGGICFIRVPDFTKNPNDVFTVDHLSKLTPESIRNLASRAGFSVKDIRHMGVAVHAALIADREPVSNPYNPVSENQDIVHKNEEFARAAMSAIENARESAKRDGSQWAIFGLAASGLFAPFYLGFPPDEIAAYLDDNDSIWGNSIHGRPIQGPQKIPELGIKHVALVISPVYFEKVRPRIEEIGAKVHLPEV